MYLPAVLLAFGLIGRTGRLGVRALLATKRAMPPDQVLTNAKMLIAAGKWPEARGMLLPAVVAKPPRTDLLIAYGECSIRCGDFDDAFEALHQVLALEPRQCPARNQLGVVNHLMGQVSDAISCFEDVLAINPNFRAAYINLAHALRESKRQREALACLERALGRWPDLRTGRRASSPHRPGRWGTDRMVLCG